MWQIPARRSARVGEANGLNQPHSQCRETKLTKRKTGDQVGRASGFAPSSSSSGGGGSRREATHVPTQSVLTELEFEVEPTNIRHTHIPPPSSLPSASFVTTAAFTLGLLLVTGQKILETACIHSDRIAWPRTCLSLGTRAYVLNDSRASIQPRAWGPPKHDIAACLCFQHGRNHGTFFLDDLFGRPFSHQRQHAGFTNRVVGAEGAAGQCL